MKLIIFGTSDIARCAYEYFTYDSSYEVVGFTVDECFLNGEDSYLDLPLVSFETLHRQFSPENHHAFIAVGSQRLNRTRAQKCLAMKQKGYSLASYVSSKAFVWKNVRIGEHAFILENNTLQPFVEIGDNVTLWSGNHIGHSTKIENNCFITSHVVVSGLCVIGENTFIGVNAAIGDNVKIGRDNFIGMNATISSNTSNNAIISAPKSEISKISATRFCRVPECV